MQKYTRFLTVEGVDGAGKSTAIKALEDFLTDRGQSFINTCEPGGTDLGQELRKIIKTKPMDLVTETMLLFSARAEHVSQVIRPALDQGKWVLCDRFTDSTVAYQHYGKGLEYKKIKSLIDLVQEDLVPGSTFILDVPLHVSRQRMEKRGLDKTDKFEAEADLFFQKVIDGYKNIAKKEPSRCHLIDAQLSPELVAKSITEKLEFIYLKELQRNESAGKTIRIK